ncbi:MAG: AMP-binding protein, partial [bacterium]|nr:AMP-binding protein [bacterium]
HIISDGMSGTILVKEFMAIYKGEQLPRLNLRYRDYAEWQNSPVQKKALEMQKEYWTGAFAGEIPVLNIYPDYPRPRVQSFDGETTAFEIETEHTRTLNHLAQKENVTLYMLLLAIFNVLLAKLSGQEDIVVGTPVAGRRHADLGQVIGMFVNTLGLRNRPEGQYTFSQFLRKIKNGTLEAFENQDYPFEELLETVNVDRDVSHNPLFDVMFILQNIDLVQVDIPGLTVTPYSFEKTKAKFDLVLQIAETGEKLIATFGYCTELFKKETVKRYIHFYKKIMQAILEDPHQKISGIEIIPQEEKKKILYEFNETGASYTENKTIHELFEEQVTRTPDKKALVGVKTREREQITLTYRQLNEQAHTLALQLRKQGVKQGTVAAIKAERSPEMIAAILGVLKTGAAYLPINPKTPEARRSYMLKDSNATVLLTTPEPRDQQQGETKNGTATDNGSVNHITLEELSPVQEYTADAPASPVPSVGSAGSSDPAYVIYTSGSTGKPKGVLITHSNFSQLVHWGYGELKIEPQERVIQNLSYYFDWSVWEIFITLTTGAALFTITEEIWLNPGALVDFIRENRITVLHITPTQYQHLIETGKKLETLNYLILGAEKLTVDLLERSLKTVNTGCRVFNMYGPTEATIISAVLEVQTPREEEYKGLSSVPIGGPVGNLCLMVLDRDLNMTPIGGVGELYITGGGVARGYL